MIQDALRRLIFQSCLLPVCLIACCSNASAADQLIRGKEPDRGTYRPPVLAKGKVQPIKITELRGDNDEQDNGGLVDAPLGVPNGTDDRDVDRTSPPAPILMSDHHSEPANAAIQTVSYEQVADQHIHIDSPAGSVQACSCESCSGGPVFTPMTVMSEPMFDAGCDAAPCDSGGCDGSGCDSIGCGRCGRLGLPKDKWFGSIELLLMFRKGDRIPALVSTGALDDPTTQVLAGREKILRDLTGGGRLTLGAWLDDCKDRSIVGRGWFAGEQNYRYFANQDTQPIIARPFFNVTDGQTPAQDTQVIATPGSASGQIDIRAESHVYGADISIRQLSYKRMGGTIDLLYGYQFMRVDESLSISSRATALDGSSPPVGSVIAISDAYDIENEFHGGQLGIASHYREGCWSFSSLAKIGFGGLRRRSKLSANTLISNGGTNANDPNGLLVRSTNSGKKNDDTFGWVPELDLTLGWQRYPAFDVTLGYHIIAMTDALQVSGAIDPELASNLAPNPTGAQRPTSNFRHGTFYVQGIHFGIAYIH